MLEKDTVWEHMKGHRPVAILRLNEDIFLQRDVVEAIAGRGIDSCNSPGDRDFREKPVSLFAVVDDLLEPVPHAELKHLLVIFVSLCILNV